MDTHHDDFKSLVGALKGSLAYALFGILWIYFSDAVLAALVTDPGRLSTLQTYKGWFFILVTAVLVYYLLDRHGLAMRQTREELQQSETSLDLLFRALPVGAGTAKGRVLATVNERLCEITGYSREEMVGLETRRLYVDDAEAERVGRIAYRETAEKGTSFLEARWRRKDGQVRRVLVGLAVARKGADPTDVVFSVTDITEQREQEALYRLLFEGANDALFLMDDRTFVDCNSRALEMYGAQREDLVGTSPLAFSPEVQPDGRASAQAAREHIIAAMQGEPQVFEWLHHRLDKTPFHAEISLNRIDRGDGVCLLAIARNITRRKQDEAALAISEERLSLALEAANDGLWDWNVATGEAYFSPRYYTMVGYAPGEFPGTLENWLIRLHPDDREQVVSQQDDYLEGRAPGYEVEFRFLAKDGSWRWILSRGKIVARDAGGRALRVVGTHVDITERKRAEAARRKSEESLSSIFRAVPTGIAVIRNRVLETVNDRFCEIFGYTREELLSQGTGMLYASEEEYRRCGQGIYRDLDNGGVSSVECRMVRKDGQGIHVLINSTLLESGEGGPAVTSSALDITERKQALEALRAKEDYLASIFRAAPVGIAVLENRVMATVNDRLCEILGYEREELEGQSTRMLYVSEEEYQRCGREIYGSLKDLGTCYVEAAMRRKDGQEVLLLLNAARLSPGGDNPAVTFSVLDITDRKQVLEALRASEDYLASIFRVVPTGVAVVEDRAMVEVNDRFCEIFGYSREELVGRTAEMLYASPEEYRRCGQEYYSCLEKQGVCAVEAHGVRKDGRKIYLLVNASMFSRAGGGKTYTFSVLDITDRKRVEEELRTSRDTLEDMVCARTRELVESNAELQRLIASSDGRSVQAAVLNDMGELLQACETEEETYQVVGGVCAKLFPEDAGCVGILDEADWSIKVVAMWGNVEDCTMEFAHNDCWAIRRGKAHVVLEPDTDPLCNHVGRAPECGTLCVPMGAQGRVLGMAHLLLACGLKDLGEKELRRVVNDRRILLSGVVERYAPSLVNLRLRETLREQSIRDRLTGLFNRRHMEETLRRELARARRRNLALGVIMIDVDHFKRFNDAYGHDTGDEVLRVLGRFLLDHVRAEDIPCRYGGEELLLILPDSHLEASHTRAEDIRRGIEQEVAANHAGRRLQVTASLGVAAYPAHGQDVESLLAAADAALYKAKEDGRNRVAAYAS